VEIYSHERQTPDLSAGGWGMHFPTRRYVNWHWTKRHWDATHVFTLWQNSVIPDPQLFSLSSYQICLFPLSEEHRVSLNSHCFI
jgi:hypothetical protein